MSVDRDRKVITASIEDMVLAGRKLNDLEVTKGQGQRARLLRAKKERVVKKLRLARKEARELRLLLIDLKNQGRWSKNRVKK